MIPVSGCTSSNGWDWGDLNPWGDDEPSYSRLESDIIAAPEPGQPVRLQQPGVVAPPGYATGIPAPPPGYGYYPPPSAYYGAPPSLGVSPSGCPVPRPWSGYPQPSYPVQPPPASMPMYSPQGYSPQEYAPAVPAPSSSRLLVAPGTQVSQEVISEQELARRYQILNHCTTVGGNAQIGFYCDDYE